MNRTVICLAVVLAALGPVRSARADNPPTKQQLEAAKEAFLQGKALHDQGKLLKAVDKFKESYRLSRNPLLLYNIGLTLDEAGKKDSALLYYQEFLSQAPQGAAQRSTASARVKAIEREKLAADLNSHGSSGHAGGEHHSHRIKPAGTYGAKDFQHQAIEDAPPGKPLDLTAYVPQDSGFTVTLYYRGAGHATFIKKPMRWHYKELIGRIPASAMTGTSIQYYLEVRNHRGKLVTRSGKPTDPNLVSIEAGAQPRFYPDFTDDTATTSAAAGDNENPLGPSGPTPHHEAPHDQPAPAAGGHGFFHDVTQVGTKKFRYAKWGATGTAGVLVALGITTYILAGQQAGYLVSDSTSCGTPPCRQFDHTYDQAWQSAGETYQTVSNITFGVGIAAAVVAGYFWYRELTAKKHGEVKASAPSDSGLTWTVGPAIGDGFAGAGAVGRF